MAVTLHHRFCNARCGRSADRLAIDVADEGDQTLLEFAFRADADMAQDRARQFGEEAFDDIEPRPVGWREGEGEAPDRLRRQPASGLARDMSGMIVEDDFNRGVRGVAASGA